MNANWFIGLPVASGAWFECLAAPAGCRRFAPSDLHLTVAFLGGVSEEAARAAFGVTRFALGPTDVTLGAVVPMGPPQRYSALSALLVTGRAEVEAAMGGARTAAYEAAGIPGDRRPPKAHVTLARPKRSASADERQRALEWANGLDVEGVAVRLEEIALYTWAEARDEALFRIVARTGLPTSP